MKYIPKPKDTSDVRLPAELEWLAEEIARNVHEVWAANRIEEGWTYGEKRDDEKKTHPGLVPYDELPESEKEYDRATSQETLKLIIKMGFNVSKKREITHNAVYSMLLSLLRKSVNAELLYDRLKRQIKEVIGRHIPRELLVDGKGRVVNVLPDSLDLELPDKVVAEFKECISSEYKPAEHLQGLLERIEKMRVSLETEELKKILSKFRERLDAYALHYSEIKRPDYQLKSLRKKYEDAKRITLREHLMQDNNKDVADFAEALATYCADLCEVELSLALSRLYADMARSRQFIDIINRLK